METTAQPDIAQLLTPASALIRKADEIVFWGRGMEELYGFSSAEAVGRTVSHLLRTRSSEPLDLITQKLTADGVWRGNLERVSKRGELRLVRSQWLPVRLADGGDGVAEVDVDVSAILEHRLFESRLIEQAEALWRSNRELEQFAYACSHDLKEPVRKIANFVQLLESKHVDTLDPEARHYFRNVSESATRMGALISGLTAYARLQRPATSRVRVQLRSVVESVLTEAKPAVTAASTTVQIDSLPDVSADVSQVHQLIENLIENAIKFRSADRPLEIRVSGEREEGHVRIGVADNGIGIEPLYREQIFKVFQRLHPASRYPGTGVGLAVCRKIVEGHGGRIWVESQPGQGSTFFFTLPAQT